MQSAHFQQIIPIYIFMFIYSNLLKNSFACTRRRQRERAKDFVQLYDFNLIENVSAYLSRRRRRQRSVALWEWKQLAWIRWRCHTKCVCLYILKSAFRMSYIWGAFGIFRGRRWENEVLKKEWKRRRRRKTTPEKYLCKWCCCFKRIMLKCFLSAQRFRALCLSVCVCLLLRPINEWSHGRQQTTHCHSSETHSLNFFFLFYFVWQGVAGRPIE